MRAVLVAVAAVAVVGHHPTGQAAPTVADPWEGKYLKFADHGYRPDAGWWTVPRVEITKTADGYSLGKAYPGVTFQEVKKGVLRGSVGLLTLGTTEFVDGTKARVLKAEFCYESFVLYDLKDKPVPGARADR